MPAIHVTEYKVKSDISSLLHMRLSLSASDVDTVLDFIDTDIKGRRDVPRSLAGLITFIAFEKHKGGNRYFNIGSTLISFRYWILPQYNKEI